MNTHSVKTDLLNSLKGDSEFRHAWNLENVYTGLSFQIRALREQRGWSQVTLGKTAKMAQERISILEDPNAETKPTLSTLLRIADAYDVGLDVRFVPYSIVLDRSTHTNLKELEVPGFEEEVPAIENQIALESMWYGWLGTEAQVNRGQSLYSGESVLSHYSKDIIPEHWRYLELLDNIPADKSPSTSPRLAKPIDISLYNKKGTPIEGDFYNAESKRA